MTLPSTPKFDNAPRINPQGNHRNYSERQFRGNSTGCALLMASCPPAIVDIRENHLKLLSVRTYTPFHQLRKAFDDDTR